MVALPAPLVDEDLRLARHTFAGDRVVDYRCQAFATEVIDHAQDAELATADQRIRHRRTATGVSWRPSGSGLGVLKIDPQTVL